MATYIFKCKLCPARASTDNRENVITCKGFSEPHGDCVMVRDYRSEGVGIAVQQLRDERNAGGRKDYDNLFLPDNKDFQGPGDPDGNKGMRQWREEHQPKDTNKRPRWPGEVDKRVW